MKRRGYLLGGLILLLTLGFAHVVAAQDAPRKDEGKATIEGRAGDNSFDLRIQKNDPAPDRPLPGPEGDRSVPGPQGPRGEPGPQGPSGPAGGTVLGMDSTVALFVGLGLLAVVIVAIVAASRGRE
jgi:hypothetical protein